MEDYSATGLEVLVFFSLLVSKPVSWFPKARVKGIHFLVQFTIFIFTDSRKITVTSLSAGRVEKHISWYTLVQIYLRNEAKR